MLCHTLRTVQCLNTHKQEDSACFNLQRAQPLRMSLAMVSSCELEFPHNIFARKETSLSLSHQTYLDVTRTGCILPHVVCATYATQYFSTPNPLVVFHLEKTSSKFYSSLRLFYLSDFYLDLIRHELIFVNNNTLFLF